MKTSEQIKGMEVKDILKELKLAEKELLEIRIKTGAAQDKDTSKRSKQRKYIARLKTILREKENAN
jgi:ribosomal protein L29